MRNPFAPLAALAALLFATAPLRAAESTPPEAQAPTFGAAFDEGEAFVPGEIAVDLRDDVTETDVADLERGLGIDLVDASRWSDSTDRLEQARVEPSRFRAILDRLRGDNRVERAEPMALYRALLVPNDPEYASKQWHLKHVGSEAAWEYACGAGVTVAVIDTGIACYDEPPFAKGTDLAGTRCVGGYNFVDDKPEAYDDHGHGTHVAGTIAQTTNNGLGVAGLAYCARLMPVKVLSKRGFGSTTAVAQGIRYAADHGAQVINLSLGGPIKSAILEKAIAHARSRGAIVVAAAGNSGRSVGYPAAYDGVIAVSATDSADRIAWFSSRGPEVRLAAPGVAVTQQTICDGGKNRCELFQTFNGTSMASPHVAGAAALVVGLGVTEPGAVKEALTRSARTQNDPKLFGAGILDVGGAVRRVFLSHTLTRLFALGVLAAAVGRRIRKRGGVPIRSPWLVAVALAGAVGLAPFAPWLHLPGLSGDWRWLVELAMRPIGEWDLVAGAGWHRWLPLANALPVLLGAALFFGSARLRPFLGAYALGSAALMADLALFGGVHFALGTLALKLWMLANIAISLWVARIALDAKRA